MTSKVHVWEARKMQLWAHFGTSLGPFLAASQTTSSPLLKKDPGSKKMRIPFIKMLIFKAASSILGPIWTIFGTIFGTILDRFGTVLGPSWVILGRPLWDHFGTIFPNHV